MNGISWLLLAALLTLVCLYLLEHGRYKRLKRDLTYINDRLAAFSHAEGYGYILIPCAEDMIRKTCRNINHFLEELYEHRAACVRSRKEMTQMITNISHDLRTPLTVLRGYSEILCQQARKEKLSEKLWDAVSQIDVKSGELVKMIREFFDISRLESGDMLLDNQVINLTQLCQGVILEYYDLLEKEQFRVEIRTPDRPLYGRGDQGAMGRILKNLIENAIRYGGDGKYLAIRLEEKDGSPVIEIEDHGQGIRPDEQEHIFARAYTSGRRHYGSGLGLAIAKGFAHQMDMDLAVESEPGRRTIFRLSGISLSDS